MAEGKNSVREYSLFLKLTFGTSERITNSGNKSAGCSFLLKGLLNISVTQNEKLN